MPRPRKNLVTYHGVFAPNASYRERIVPPPAEEDAEQPAPAFRTCQHRRKNPSASRVPHQPRLRRVRRYTWAELLRRAFGIDVLVCPHCGEKRKLLTFLTNPRTIQRVLAHLGLPTSLPEIAPARGPPQQELLFQD